MDIQKYFMKKYDNNFIMKIHGNKFQKVGVPDIMLILDGGTYFIETKVGNNKPSAVQCTVIQELRDAGVIADVAYTLEEAIQIIEEGRILWDPQYNRRYND